MALVRFDGAPLSAEMAVLLHRCRRLHGWPGRLTGPLAGARTYSQQEALWLAYLRGTGAPASNPAAPDPQHRHRHMRSNIAALGGWSQAVDVSFPVELIAAAKKEGVVLHRPYLPRETWHLESARPWRLRSLRAAQEAVAIPSDLVLVHRMRAGRDHGRVPIVNPVWTLREARRAGLPLPLACAMLEQETFGGHNVFGHDDTIFVGAGAVTKAKYLDYKRLRRQGRGMQGVGPCQLTWWATQDRADALGGCWVPRWNLRVGFETLMSSVRGKGLHAGVAAYNGTGAKAEAYADRVLRLAALWRAHLFR